MVLMYNFGDRASFEKIIRSYRLIQGNKGEEKTHTRPVVLVGNGGWKWVVNVSPEEARLAAWQ